MVKFQNRKHFEKNRRLKKIISSCSKFFIFNFSCPYYCFLWGKCKDLQWRGVINQIFCLAAVVIIKVSENEFTVKIYYENDLKVYQGYGNSSDGESIKISLFLKVCSQGLFWFRGCTAQKPVKFINWLYSVLHCCLIHKKSCALILVRSVLVFLSKTYIGQL